MVTIIIHDSVALFHLSRCTPRVKDAAVLVCTLAMLGYSLAVLHEASYEVSTQLDMFSMT